MANKVGPLIKDARTGAKLTQEQLAKKAGGGLTASDISKAERGELELTQASLKAIAKATGVTQASLLNAAKESTYSGKKTSSSSAKKTTSSAKKTSSSGKKTSSAKKTEEEFKLTAAEKKLVELYRAADKTTKENAVKLLKGEKVEGSGLLDSLLGGAMEMISGKK